jgi:predicted dehydrogenase
MNAINRRSFVKSAALAAAGFSIIPGLHSCSSNNRLNIAFIGVGGRGNANRNALPKDEEGNVIDNVVALCDVSEERAAEGFSAFPNARRFSDFRKMFDEMHKEIDAVVISTPDHTHFPAAMAAMELGMHVYVEKPLAHSIWQLRTMKKAANHYDIISQMGNQGHTTEGIRFVKEWYEADVLGDVTEVIAWFNGPHFHEEGYFNYPNNYPPLEEPIPNGLNWDAWIGPANMRPYSHFYLPKWWRGWYDFGCAELGDWACHTLDAPFWSLDLGMPVSVDPVVRTSSPEGFTPDQSHLVFQFPARGSKPPVTLHWYEGGLQPENRPEWGLEELPGSGMIMVGSKKSLMTGGRPNQPRLLVPEEEWQAFTQAIPKRTIPRVGEEQPQLEWINAIKGTGAMPGSNFNYAAELTEMAIVGVMAQRFNSKIEYDAANMKITNRADLNEFLKDPAREGWRYGEGLGT